MTEEEFEVFCGRVVCDERGIHYICIACDKEHISDFDALMCCFPE